MVFYEDLFKTVHPKWKDFLDAELHEDYFQSLLERLQTHPRPDKIYPPKAFWFKAFEFFAPQDCKALILGQDPYHGPGQAHGLSFSVPLGQGFPPSLRNIFKELEADMGLQAPFSGDLSPWAEQGILLVNSALTVEEAKAGAHLKWGWEEFSDRLIAYLSAENPGMAFVLWGKFAQRKARLIEADKHLVLKHVHPSPLSAYRGFFGSKPFSKVNDFLSSIERNRIEWALD